MINYTGKWYLVAYDLQTNSLRTFLIARISKMQISDKIKGNKYNFDKKIIDKYITGGFGIYNSLKSKKAIIRFYGKVATMVKNQFWHKDQKIEIKCDKQNKEYVEFTIPYSLPDELLGKVIRYSEYAEIISPKSLRDLWLIKIERMYKKYIVNESKKI